MQTNGPMDRSGLIRTGQIIVGALAAGVLFFLVIVIGVLGSPMRPLDPQAVVSLVMAALAIACIPARLIVPVLIVNVGCQKIARGGRTSPSHTVHATLPNTDEGNLLQLFMTKLIVGCAILEGAAFGNLVAYMLEGQLYSLALAIVCTIGMLAAFPTRSGVDEWLERHVRRVKELRS